MRQIFTKNKNVPDGRISAVRRVLAFVLLLALCCVSCRNLIEAPDEPAEIAESGGGTEAAGKLYTLSGAVGAGGAVPSSLAANSRSAAFGDTGGGIENGVYGDADGTAIQSGRAAAANARSATYSSGQLAGVSYTVTATTVRSPDSDKNPPGTEKTVDATAVDDGSHRFYIELLEGTYTLSVEGFLGESDGKKKILEGTYRNAGTNNTVVIGPASSPDDCNILVHPIFDGGGTGTVSLTLFMEADCNIKCLKAVWEADGGTKTKTFTDGGNDLTTALFTMTADGESSSGIPAGFHHVDFYFYGDEGGTDELYSCSQALNVFENLTTDLWRNNGATPYIDDDGNFMLTRSVIYSRKLFYVQNRNDSKKGEGTRYSPFDSVQTAVQKILAANDGASEYKIALLSDDTDKSTSSYTADTSRSYICINPDKPLKLIIESDISESRDTNGGNPFTIDAARDADKTGRVMYIGQNAEVTLNNIKITGGYSEEQGGGIHSIGTLIFSGVTVSGCHATYGGGLYNSKGTLTITGGAITGCTATESGGGIYNSDGTFTIESGTVSGNTAEKNGGGVGSYGTFTMKGGIISGNTAKCANSFGGGGGLYIYGGRCSLEGGTISGNRAEDKTDRNGGGGVYIYSGTFTVSGGTIGGSTDGDKNEAKRGGGIYNDTGTFTMTGGSVIGNKGTMGGGIYIYSSFNFEGGIIGGNTASSGGGVYVYRGTFTMSGAAAEISGNEATGSGGGVYVSSTNLVTAKATFTMNSGTVSGNTASSGGGVYNTGTLTVSGGSIENCTAGTSGGGIYNNVTDASITCTLTDCTISGCKALGTASGQGGGGICNIAGTLELTDVNITGSGDETAQDARSGGGIYNKGTLTVTGGTIKNCTSLYAGGGVYNSTGTLKITDGTISACITKEGRGGGICSSGDGVSAEIKDCIIQSCEATTSSGGGISNETGTLTMTGGKITGNTAAKSGGGVYNTGTFTMGGSASVPAGDDGKNDVYLASGKTIGIASTLTAESPVATITLADGTYTAGTAVLSAADGSTATLADECEKFAVTEDDWKIDGEGKLVFAPVLYVSAGGSDTDGTGTKSKPFAAMQKAFDEIQNRNDSTVSYTIRVSGTVTGTSTIASGIPAAKIVITGETGTDTDILDGNADTSAYILDVQCSAPVEITDVHITNGNKGGVRVYSNADVTMGAGTLISKCKGNGVYVYWHTSKFIMNGGEISGNSGGVQFYGSEFTMNGGKISNNTDYGVYIDDTFTMSGGTISGNTGPGVHVFDSGTFTMSGGTISGNTGPGVYVYSYSSSSGTFTMKDGTITDNTATRGGGIYNLGKFTMEGGTISGNKATNSGGGIYNSNGAELTVTGGSIEGCTTSSTDADTGGGGIYNAAGGTVEITGAKISSCTAQRTGGGIYNFGTLRVSGTDFTQCKTITNSGGGICNSSGATATVTNCNFTNCEAALQGGGIRNAGTLTISGVTYSGCTATTGGSDIYDVGTITP